MGDDEVNLTPRRKGRGERLKKVKKSFATFAPLREIKKTSRKGAKIAKGTKHARKSFDHAHRTLYSWFRLDFSRRGIVRAESVPDAAEPQARRGTGGGDDGA